jgi:hypothetical protein
MNQVTAKGSAEMANEEVRIVAMSAEIGMMGGVMKNVEEDAEVKGGTS